MHRLVVGLHRHGFDGGVQDLVLVHEGDHRHRRLDQGEHPVVVSGALPEPVPEGVDRQRRDEQHIGQADGVLAEPGAGRLRTAQAVRRVQLAHVVGPVQSPGGAHDRQQHPDACPGERRPQRGRARLAGQRGVEGDAGGGLHLGQFADDHGQRDGVLGALLRRPVTPLGPDPAAQRRLGHGTVDNGVLDDGLPLAETTCGTGRNQRHSP